MSIHTVVDGGRLHIASDEKYLGSVNSYNNRFTIFFSKVFFLSTEVMINGKTKHVNAKSYVKLLNNIGQGVHSTRQLKKFSQFNNLPVQASVSLGLMRDHLSENKKSTLFTKLVQALLRKDEASAEKYIAKGAPDQNFWIRDNGYGISTRDESTGLPAKPANFKATHYSPLLYAAKEGMNQLFPVFERYKTNRSFVGEEVEFKREIADLRQESHVEVHHGRHQGRHHRLRPYARVVNTTRVDLKDVATPLHDLKLTEQNEVQITEPKNGVRINVIGNVRI